MIFLYFLCLTTFTMYQLSPLQKEMPKFIFWYKEKKREEASRMLGKPSILLRLVLGA